MIGAAPRWSGTVRLARADELNALAIIESDANATLVDAGAVSPDSFTTTPRHLLELSLSAALLFTAVDANDEPVGFLACEERDGGLYVGEIDVLRRWQRQGIGRALMLTALAEARSRRLWGAMLTTDRFVPFNALFYASLGFREIARENLPPSLEAVIVAEVAGGQDPARRVGMALRFA